MNRFAYLLALNAVLTSAQSSSVSSASTSASSTSTPPFVDAFSLTTLSPVSLPSDLPVSILTQSADYESLFNSYYSGADPAQSSLQPQPVVVNDLDGSIYPENLTNPYSIPMNDTTDSAYLPPSVNASLASISAEILDPNFNISSLSTPSSLAIVQNASAQIEQLLNSSATDATSKCQTCYAALQIAQSAARQVPWEIPAMLSSLCQTYKFSSSPPCSTLFAPNIEGGPATQILYFANLSSTDAQAICYNQFKVCAKPRVTDYYPKLTDLVSSPKPSNATAPVPSGRTPLKVLHLSDIHLDSRYLTSSESNCTSSLCCRSNAVNKALLTTASNASAPAPRYGAFMCDSPMDLVVSAFEAIPALTGTQGSGPAFTLFTGDIVSHDPINEVTTDYAIAEEGIVYSLFHKFLSGDNQSTAIYPTVSNHDGRYGSGWNAPQNLQPAYLQDLYQKNYDFLTSLWQKYGWLDSEAASQSRTHYTAYSAKTPQGLRIIALNGNLYYPGNIYNYLNTSNADQYGQFAFLTAELEKAEAVGERVWIIMHQDLGWDGQNGLPNPTDLMYQIIDRFSPHVIANLFAGHTHELQHMVYYSDNATTKSSESALSTCWIGGSIVPLTNLNSGFQMYDVDPQTFDIMESYSWYSDVQSSQKI